MSHSSIVLLLVLNFKTKLIKLRFSVKENRSRLINIQKVVISTSNSTEWYISQQAADSCHKHCSNSTFKDVLNRVKKMEAASNGTVRNLSGSR